MDGKRYTIILVPHTRAKFDLRDAAVSGLASAPNFTVQLRPLLSSTMIFSEVPDDDLLTNVNLSEGFGAASRPPRP